MQKGCSGGPEHLPSEDIDPKKEDEMVPATCGLASLSSRPRLAGKPVTMLEFVGRGTRAVEVRLCICCGLFNTN
jgi:hypothetical protein